jgi:hypothetical protein
MSEQDRYGTTKTAQPIPIQNDNAIVVGTPNPTEAPNPRAMDAYNATVRKDLQASRKQHRSDAS